MEITFMEDYLESFRHMGYSEERVAQYRKEFTSDDVDVKEMREEDYEAFLILRDNGVLTKMHKEYK